VRTFALFVIDEFPTTTTTTKAWHEEEEMKREGQLANEQNAKSLITFSGIDRFCCFRFFLSAS